MKTSSKRKPVKSVAQQLEAVKKAPAPRPRPSEITYERVRELLVKHAKEHREGWLAVVSIIDLMNGWDGKGVYNNASLIRARKKLQQHSGWTTHERPTSAQASAVRKHLDKLVEEKVVEKARGHTDGNNSWGFRWITFAMLAKRVEQQVVSEKAQDIARRLSLALGGDGESGVKPFLTPDDTIGIRVNLYGQTAERLLEALKMADVSPDFFTGKHWEIVGPTTGEVMGCTADREDVRREEPDATFREVKIAECSSCHGGAE
jgi:hypothetical protein